MKYLIPPRQLLRLLRHILMVAMLIIAVWVIIVAIRYHRHRANDTEKKIEAIVVGVVGKITAEGDTLTNPFAIDAIRHFSIDNKAAVNIAVYPSWYECLHAFNEMKCNIIATPVPTTMEMKHHHKLSIPFYESAPQLIQRIDNKIPSSVLDLDSATIWIEEHSPYKAQMKHLMDEAGIEIVLNEANKGVGIDSLAILTLNKEIDYFITDERTAFILTKRHPELFASLPLGVQQPMSWIVEDYRATLSDLVDYWMERFKETNDYSQLMTNYFTNSQSNKKKKRK
ncbi:MAG: transporter substrate-binding domain-containing protein [Paludibacteraceae bacterium]|nr:transporter substrate-binding domain-containing protein [Paludibacteraceae bacterium]